ncbi:PD-(D/E)XK nuclease family protein [Rheinheimera sp. UJ51]|uniref:PDDEXK-like family protein n=1 Tax=Rheinheimera sp. UJ51 TaxID=2892446 RepID=UPI001E52A4E2|nr:PD-(D/E)XK nuclease family protein [Rheinheimera sp. UJ51]MCC5451809.1 PD-(D/E)XK nuclease family protein [Rheinheimera sp. UJ51]
MDTTLIKLQQLLADFKQLPPLNVAEQSIFSIGSKGYYENPTTDILAFFCNDNGQHKLGNTALKALFNCLNDVTSELDCSLISPPEREVVTKDRKRIDLLLESANWVMVVENKIFHQQNNPFDDYENFILVEQANRFANKKKLFVVLAPTKEVTLKGWHFISYSELIAALKAQLAELFISQPIHKWLLLLREFILHLESLMSQPSLNQETLDFVLKNLTEIKDIQQIKQDAINEYLAQLQTALQRKLDKVVNARIQNWGGYPALRFSLADWNEPDWDVVLFLSGKADTTEFCVYAILSDGLTEQKADAIVMPGLNPKRDFEKYGRLKVRKYSLQLAVRTQEQIIEFIYDRLLELDTLIIELKNQPAIPAL